MIVTACATHKRDFRVHACPIVIQAPQRRTVLLPLPREAAIRRHAAVPRLAIGIILHLAVLVPARVEGEAGAAEMIAGEVSDAATLPHGEARAPREVVCRRHARADVLLKERARACPDRSRRVDRRLPILHFLHAVAVAIIRVRRRLAIAMQLLKCTSQLKRMAANDHRRGYPFIRCAKQSVENLHPSPPRGRGGEAE